MEKYTFRNMASVAFIALLPLMSGCSLVSGSSTSDSPVVSAQQERVNELKDELKEAERYTSEAKQREKAAKSRLKAAEHELKAAEEQAKRRGY